MTRVRISSASSASTGGARACDVSGDSLRVMRVTSCAETVTAADLLDVVASQSLDEATARALEGASIVEAVRTVWMGWSVVSDASHRVVRSHLRGSHASTEAGRTPAPRVASTG